jgi:tetratricopeptide (TPR) repeat protein
MKKIFLMMLGATLLAAPVSAQNKIDVDKLRTAIAKSDADIANPKSAAKAATWTKRGEAFINADAAPVSGLYVGMPENMLRLSIGDVPSTQETLGERTYTVYNTGNAKVYVVNGSVDFYTATTVVDPAALDKAYEAFGKAYELDPKTAKRVGEGMATIRIKSFENGAGLYTLGKPKIASTEFRRAFTASSHPAAPAIDTMALYYAGMMGVYAGSDSKDPADFTAALADLDKAISMGYEENGDVYQFKFLALYNLERKAEALQALQIGIGKYPGSEKLIDLAMRYYAENDEDPTAIIPLVENAIAKNPNNPVLYQGLARVYDKLGQTDNAISTMEKAVALAPDDFLSNYFLGQFILQKGDEMNTELGNRNFTSRAESEAARAAVLGVFRRSVAPLEKAYGIDPTEVAAVELLKNVTFALRDEEGMQAKFEKYDALFKSMTAQ